MMFCPKCGALLTTKQIKDKMVMACSCGYSSKEGPQEIKEKVTSEQKEIAVVSEDEKIYPLTDEPCPKCGHLKAYFWTQQTRGADEPETKFFKCEKCKHSWRDYS